MLNSTLIAKVDHTITQAIKDAVKTGDREAAVSWSGAQIEFMLDPEAFCSQPTELAEAA